jgi:hypothetical protein
LQIKCSSTFLDAIWMSPLDRVWITMASKPERRVALDLIGFAGSLPDTDIPLQHCEGWKHLPGCPEGSVEPSVDHFQSAALHLLPPHRPKSTYASSSTRTRGSCATVAVPLDCMYLTAACFQCVATSVVCSLTMKHITGEPCCGALHQSWQGPLMTKEYDLVGNHVRCWVLRGAQSGSKSMVYVLLWGT